VHGITASRLVEEFGKPTALFAPKGEGNGTAGTDDGRPRASGSFRGVPGFHVRNALQAVADREPGLLDGFGGHEGAAGATLAVADIPRFAELFETAVREQLGDGPLRPVLWVDADWPAELLCLDTLDVLAGLDPWGKDFPSPTLQGLFRVCALHAMGNGAHLRLSLEREGKRFAAVWFNATEEKAAACGIKTGQTAAFVYRLGVNFFKGERFLQMLILLAIS
jgi:single-stranded-DNA-specific exonuclease